MSLENQPDADRAERLSATRSLREATRLAAVQALYQMEIAGSSQGFVLAELDAGRLGVFDEESPGAAVDQAMFEQVIRGVVRRQGDIDRAVQIRLTTGWKLERIDAVLRAVLRAAAFELLERYEVPARAVIDSYLDLAHGFAEPSEVKFVNAALDGIARDLRPGELTKPTKTKSGPPKP